MLKVAVIYSCLYLLGGLITLWLLVLVVLVINIRVLWWMWLSDIYISWSDVFAILRYLQNGAKTSHNTKMCHYTVMINVLFCDTFSTLLIPSVGVNLLHGIFIGALWGSSCQLESLFALTRYWNGAKILNVYFIYEVTRCELS